MIGTEKRGEWQKNAKKILGKKGLVGEWMKQVEKARRVKTAKNAGGKD